jgi:hypothetical protein
MPRSWRTGGELYFVLLLVASVLALSASQPWTSKDSTQWTPAEIDRLLTNSPWAQQVMASFGKPLEPDDLPFTPPPGADQNGMAGSRGVSDGRWDGGIARNTGVGQVPSLPVTVRWDSSLPIRQALSRSYPETVPSLLARARSDYIITVIGLASASPHGATSQPNESSSADAQREAQDPAEIAQSFVANSRLTRRGKPTLAPEDAKFDSATGAIHLFFPRTEPITLADKEVTLVTRFGSLTVQKKFRLKDMTYKGQLDL